MLNLVDHAMKRVGAFAEMMISYEFVRRKGSSMGKLAFRLII